MESGTGERPYNMSIVSQNLSHIQTKTGGPIDFDGINAAARADMVDVCRNILQLEGKVEGNEYSAINQRRHDNNLGSFKVHIRGSKCGVWSDFATGDSGSDPISLAVTFEVWTKVKRPCGSRKA
jgi:hypothetical protein